MLVCLQTTEAHTHIEMVLCALMLAAIIHRLIYIAMVRPSSLTANHVASVQRFIGIFHDFMSHERDTTKNCILLIELRSSSMSRMFKLHTISMKNVFAYDL